MVCTVCFLSWRKILGQECWKFELDQLESRLFSFAPMVCTVCFLSFRDEKFLLETVGIFSLSNYSWIIGLQIILSLSKYYWRIGLQIFFFGTHGLYYFLSWRQILAQGIWIFELDQLNCRLFSLACMVWNVNFILC